MTGPTRKYATQVFLLLALLATASAVPARVAPGDGALSTVPGARLSLPVDDPVQRFYERRQMAAVWHREGRLTPAARDLLRRIDDAHRQGLALPGSPSAAWLRAVGGRAPVAAFDALLTQRYLTLARRLTGGQVDPQALPSPWRVTAGPPDADALLRRLERSPAAALAALEPRHAGQHRLRTALARYRAIERRGGWPTLPAGPTLRPGVEDRRVALLRRRLDMERTGSVSGPEAAAGQRYDAALEARVRAFQARHGLAVDGLVGPRTRAALNVPVAERVASIRRNLERWRWLPGDLGARHVWVNIPAFRLALREGGRDTVVTAAIVGRASRPTPVFSAEVSHLVVNPDWTVPQRIARRDLLPEIREDPQVLARRNIEVRSGWADDARVLDPETIDWDALDGRFPYVLRQAPGPRNALGGIKFHMPNAHTVYLHDTPARGLFERIQRLFSSGCVRVQEIERVARALLRGGGDDPQALTRLRARGRKAYLALAEPVPVHLVYFTAWAEPDGTVHFRPDVYGRDRALQAALDARARAHGRAMAPSPGSRYGARSIEFSPAAQRTGSGGDTPARARAHR